MKSTIWLVVFALTNVSLPLIVAAEPKAEDLQFFEQHIRPLLQQHCYQCHSAEAEVVESGLQLDSRPAWEQGGDSGPAIVPGKPEESLFIHAC